MANYGYGGFLYGRGVYGENRGQAGAVASAWNSSSQSVAQRAPSINMPHPAWVWHATAVANPIDAGRMASKWESRNSNRNAQITANPRYTPHWVWTDKPIGIMARSGTTYSNWASTSKIKASLRVFQSVTSSAAWNDHIDGLSLQVATVDNSAKWVSNLRGNQSSVGRLSSLNYSYDNIRGQYRPAVGVRVSSWKESSIARATASYISSYQGIPWLESSTINGHLLWESQPDGVDPLWTPKSVSDVLWIPSNGQASPWKTINR